MSWIKRLRSLNWPSSWRDGAHFAAHLLLPIAWGYAALRLPAMVQTGSSFLCGYDTDYLPDWWLLPVGIAALLAGRFVSVWNAPPKGGTLGQRPTRASTTLAQIALACAFAMLVLVWFMEALGTAHVGVATGTLEPITWYVRCAIYHDRFVSTFSLGPWSHIGGWTLGIAITACYTVGHWLWSYHPDLRPGGGGGRVAVPVGGAGPLTLQQELPGARHERETMLT